MFVELKEIDRHERSAYERGLDYIAKRGPEVFHLRSCYEGTSFQRLAQCLLFDKNREISTAEQYQERARVYLLKGKEGEIRGLRVVCSMTEFGNELDFETYVIADADTQGHYKMLLGGLSGNTNLEVVTFGPGQQEVVRKTFPNHHIHHWTVFLMEIHALKNQVPKLELLDENYLSFIKYLNDQFPIEKSPQRSLKFQLAGLPYRTYALPNKLQPVVVVCVREYCASVWEVLYVFEAEKGNQRLLIDLLQSVGHILISSGNQLIWRLPKHEVSDKNDLLSQCQFSKVAEELHYHVVV